MGTLMANCLLAGLETGDSESLEADVRTQPTLRLSTLHFCVTSSLLQLKVSGFRSDTLAPELYLAVRSGAFSLLQWNQPNRIRLEPPA